MTATEAERLRAGVAARYPLTDTRLTIGGRSWTVTSVQNQDALIEGVRTEADLEQFPYGLLLWASAVGLAERLAAEPDLVRGKRVLEVGAGVGLPGIVAHSLDARVTQTDHQEAALNLSRLNARQNQVSGIAAFLADWRAWQHTERYDVVLGADVLYERGLHAALVEVFTRSLAPGGLLLLADPLRPQATVFADNLERSGWSVALESQTVRWENDRKEIALFFARPDRK